MNASTTITVVAAVLRDEQGRVLLAQRPPGKEMAGKWELPGGKVKAGESLHDALVRELDEELGVRTTHSRPLLQLAHDYPERRVVLHAREARCCGAPRSREGQALRWVNPQDREAFAALDLLEADGPIVTAMRLPERYMITPPILDVAQVPVLFERAAAAHVGLLQLRQPNADGQQLRRLVRAFAEVTRQRIREGLASPDWLLGGDPAQTLPLAEANTGFAGLHLPARALGELASLRSRADVAGWWLFCSCHDEDELAQAKGGGADAAVLGPVLPTPTHPDQPGLGWERFATLLEDLPLPVYAIGGMGEHLLAQAWEAGGQGVAGIRGLAVPL